MNPLPSSFLHAAYNEDSPQIWPLYDTFQMSGLRKCNSTLQSCTPEMVGCPFQERAGNRAMGNLPVPSTGQSSGQLGEEAARGKGRCRAGYLVKPGWGEERRTLAETGGAVHP